MYETIRDFDITGQTVLVRVDFNVPLAENGALSDDFKIKAALPTIQYITENGGKAVLMSHLGRPKGREVRELSLRPLATYLGEVLGQEVVFVPDCVGRMAEKAVADLPQGGIAVLENTRYYAEETLNDMGFARKLANLGDIYINDAFASCHRRHASTVGITNFFSLKGVGLSVEHELETLTKAVANPQKPQLTIVGGAKIATKMDGLQNMLTNANQIMLGGAMANTFLAAKDYDVGQSLFDPECVETARNILAEAGVVGCRILLPLDVVVSKSHHTDDNSRVCDLQRIQPDDRIMDIGPRTIETWSKVIGNAQTVLWSGPLGVFEVSPFYEGTYSIANAIIHSDAFAVAGGGDTMRALTESNLRQHFQAISTAGGAFLKFIARQDLAALDCLPLAHPTRQVVNN